MVTYAHSPCIKICVIHPATRLCTGCLRTIDEIGAWSGMTQDARRKIMSELSDRTALIAAHNPDHGSF